MKKGMTVTVENDLSFILVDSVTYAGDKYFAATAVDETDDCLYFFKLNKSDNGESLELIDQNTNQKVVDALIQHMKETF